MENDKCPADAGMLVETETGRYCTSCGYIEYYIGEIQPVTKIGQELRRRYIEKHSK